MSYEIKNPLLPGFYPDPSIVRVEDDFYMVTSSFSFYPGVPVFTAAIWHIGSRSGMCWIGRPSFLWERTGYREVFSPLRSGIMRDFFI